MSRVWPSREEWAAGAERAARTACYPLERVPEEPEPYLAAAEADEMRRLHVEVSKAAKPVLTAEIHRLKAMLPQPVPAKAADHFGWLDRLTAEQRAAAHRMTTLKHLRRDVGRVASGRNDPVSGRWHPFELTVLARPAVALLSELDGWQRLSALDAKWEAARMQAAAEALDAAIARLVAERNSDEGWAKELQRRARIDGNHLTTEETPNHG